VNHLRTALLGLEGPAEPLRITGPDGAGEAVRGQGGSDEEEARGRNGKGQGLSVEKGFNEVSEQRRKKRTKRDETGSDEGARLGGTGGVVERASGEGSQRKTKKKGRKDEEQGLGIEDRELPGEEKKTGRTEERVGTGLKAKILEIQDGSEEGLRRKKRKKRVPAEVGVSQGEEQLEGKSAGKRKRKRRRKEGDEVVRDQGALAGRLQLGWIQEAAPNMEVLGGGLAEGLGGVLDKAEETEEKGEVDSAAGLVSKSEASGDEEAAAPVVSRKEKNGNTDAAREGSTSESKSESESESESEKEIVKKEKKVRISVHFFNDGRVLVSHSECSSPTLCKLHFAVAYGRLLITDHNTRSWHLLLSSFGSVFEGSQSHLGQNWRLTFLSWCEPICCLHTTAFDGTRPR
jgi:hypothetical protein